MPSASKISAALTLPSLVLFFCISEPSLAAEGFSCFINKAFVDPNLKTNEIPRKNQFPFEYYLFPKDWLENETSATQKGRYGEEFTLDTTGILWVSNQANRYNHKGYKNWGKKQFVRQSYTCENGFSKVFNKLQLAGGKFETASDTYICSIASNSITWSRTHPDYVREAKRRGLSCGVKPASKNELQPSINENNSKLINASSGSGFSVSKDGFIVTNNHVIDGCKKVYVHVSGKQVPATVITTDHQNDLALLKADFIPKEVFALSGNRPDLLQDVYVAGYPFGMNVSSSVKVTKGIISSLTGIGNNFSQVQIDAALQKGNSGGPILDENGNVVAVAVSKLDVQYAIKNFGTIPENTNFGVKSSVVASILDSQAVEVSAPNNNPMKKSVLAKKIAQGTYYLSCFMTIAQINKLQSQKVMFENIK